MTRSHADQHDLDKLSGWHRDLGAGPSEPFPVYALFLVSPDARYAHDIFREFRSSFKMRRAGYENLMIFGQHGISSTVEALLSGLELTGDCLPLLVLFREPSAVEVYSHDLPPALDESWRIVLSRLESAADADQPALDLASVPGITSRSLRNGPVKDLVGQVLEQVSENT